MFLKRPCETEVFERARLKIETHFEKGVISASAFFGHLCKSAVVPCSPLYIYYRQRLLAAIEVF